jgi:fatty acid desaturase
MTEKGWWTSSKAYYSWKFLSTSSFALTSLWLLREYAEESVPLLLLAACLMAFFFQQGGWLAHDFLHNQVFTQRKYNHFFGFITSCLWQGMSHVLIPSIN